MKLTQQAHGTDGRVRAQDLPLLGVLYNGVMFTWLVMPEILAGRTPGEITRSALEKPSKRVGPHHGMTQALINLD